MASDTADHGGDGNADPMVGRVLDNRYRLDAPIGAGGMGDVYRGLHLMMEHRVALKLLKPDLAADPMAAKRFTREAKSTSRLNHENCVRMTDLGVTSDGLMYLVMEYLDGRTVGQEIEHDGPIAPDRVMHIARQVCAALHCAHELSIVHRDLKPENIMLIQRGRDPDMVKVLDFGLAKLVSDPGGAFTAMSMTPLTREGMIFGTPEYMSPEQAIDEQLTPACDLYSLGVVMYEMLTGLLPFDSENYMEILAAHVREQPVPPHERRPELGIPESLSGLVMWLMAKSPDDRPVSASRVAEDLGHLLDRARESGAVAGVGRESRVSSDVAASATVDLDSGDIARAAISAPHAPTRRRRTGPLIAATVGLAALALVAVFALRSSKSSRSDRSAQPGASNSGSQRPVSGAVPDERANPPTNPPIEIAVKQVAYDSADAGVAGRTSGETGGASDASSRRKKPQKRTDPAVQSHLDTAERARSAGNVLEQMAHADSALQLAPKNARAAYLLGDALLGSDLERGCKYLHRARRLKKARKAYVKAGCDRID